MSTAACRTAWRQRGRVLDVMTGIKVSKTCRAVNASLDDEALRQGPTRTNALVIFALPKRPPAQRQERGGGAMGLIPLCSSCFCRQELLGAIAACCQTPINGAQLHVAAMRQARCCRSAAKARCTSPSHDGASDAQ